MVSEPFNLKFFFKKQTFNYVLYNVIHFDGVALLSSSSFNKALTIFSDSENGKLVENWPKISVNWIPFDTFMIILLYISIAQVLIAEFYKT